MGEGKHTLLNKNINPLCFVISKVQLSNCDSNAWIFPIQASEPKQLLEEIVRIPFLRATGFPSFVKLKFLSVIVHLTEKEVLAK